MYFCYSLNELCLVLDKDNRWYRAKTVEVCNTTYDVFFIDYGNTKQVNVQEIRHIPKYLTMDCITIECSLDGWVNLNQSDLMCLQQRWLFQDVLFNKCTYLDKKVICSKI